jgi:GntR family transcriptional regulator of arabinose operon
MNFPEGFPEIIIDETSAIPKYVQLANALELLIRQGFIQPDTRLPSENEFFDQLNISRSTIRNALAILERKNLVIRRQGNGTFSSSILPPRGPASNLAPPERPQAPSPVPEPRPRPTAPGGQRVIGLIVPSMKNTIYPEIVRGVEDCAHTHGYTVFIGNTYTDQNRERTLIEQMLHSGIDGLIIDPTHSLVERPDFPSYPFLSECPVPVVLLNNFIPGMDMSMVAPDDKLCGQIAADFFFSRGHRQVAMIYKACVAAAVNRRDGFVERLRQHGLSVDPAKIIGFPEEHDGDEPGFRYTINLLGLPTPPTAIFYFNDDVAIQGMMAIRESGLSVGRDVSVIGFDNISEANDPGVRLTTFDHPKQFCGKWAADILFSRINQGRAPQSVLIQPDLVIRDSVANIAP